MRLAFDIEASGLLDSTTIDYTQSPYKLKDNFVIHCAVFKDIDTNEYYKFVQEECYTKLKPWLLENCTMLIGNNIVSYDLLAMKLALDIDYTIYPDTICGKAITIFDNMVASKCQNPDRGGHSVDWYGTVMNFPKIDWRGKAIELGLIASDSPKGEEFKKYHPEMLVYNTQDADISHKIFQFLHTERGNWNWQSALELEHAVRDIITRSEHVGFKFDSEKAVECVKDLDERMEKLRNIVEPLIPDKPMGKTELKEYIPSSIQFKKNGELSANIVKWVAKHNGTLYQSETGSWQADIYDKTYTLPIPQEPIVTHTKAKIDDTTHIKGWLVELGWVVSNYKERDLTVDSKKKKLTSEKFAEAVERYVEQTLNSPFKHDRLEHIGTSEKRLRDTLLRHDCKRPLKVLTNPILTEGMEKEIDKNLLLLSDKFAHAKDVSDYLTYKHRRNSILGGGVDPDDEDEEPTKGFLGVPRLSEDGRIPTAADTCGAGTSRFKHKVVANLARVTSLYGSEIRSLFGVDLKDFYQLGFDFDGLEARIEGHYVWKYDDENKTYVKSLLGEKPNDVHTLTAKKISVIIGETFGRTPAKTVKYAASYGAQAKRVAKTIGCDVATGQLVVDAFWEAAYPLAQLRDKLAEYWKTTGKKSYIIGIDGRKVPTRSASALINSLFQSGGVICAKRAIVILDRKLKENGLWVDYFKDDWKTLQHCQNIIAYH